MEFSIETHITVDVNDMLRVIGYTLMTMTMTMTMNNFLRKTLIFESKQNMAVVLCRPAGHSILIPTEWRQI